MGGLLSQLWGDEKLSEHEIVIPVAENGDNFILYVGNDGVGEYTEVAAATYESYGGNNKIEAWQMGEGKIAQYQKAALDKALEVIPSEKLLEAGFDPEALRSLPANEVQELFTESDFIEVLENVRGDAYNNGIDPNMFDMDDSEGRASYEGSVANAEANAVAADEALQVVQFFRDVPGYLNDMLSSFDDGRSLNAGISPDAIVAFQQAMETRGLGHVSSTAYKQ